MSNGELSGLSPRRDFRILLLALGTFAIGSDNFVIAGVLHPLANEFGTRVESAGQVVTAYAATYAISSPLLTAATAHFRQERLVIAALAGFACSDIACAFSADIFAFALARIVAACCAALYIPSAYALAAALWPANHRGTAMATVALGTTLAMFVGVPIGTSVGHEFGWRVTFLFDAALGLIAVILLGVQHIVPGAIAARPNWLTNMSPIGRRRTALSILATLFWSVSTFSVYTYVSAIFGDSLKLDNIAPLLFGYGLGALTGSQLAGLLVDRFGPTRPIVVAVVVSTINFGLMTITGGTVVSAAAGLFVMAFCTWIALVAQQTRLLAIEPEHAAIVLSFLTSGIYVGAALGAGLGGALLATLSRYAPLYGAAFLMAIGLIAFLAADSSNRKGWGVT
jgi:predicted MFS family arabinose efflux permease